MSAIEIVKSSPSAWAESDVEGVFKRGEAAQDDKDIKGPVPLAVAVTGKHKEMGFDKEGETKLVVVGDADFASNQFFGQLFNRDLVLNMMAWLGGEEQQISIRPRAIQASRAQLGPEETRRIFYLSVLDAARAAAVPRPHRVVAPEHEVRPRNTLLLLLVLIALGGYLYFVERPSQEREAEAKKLVTPQEGRASPASRSPIPTATIALEKTAEGHWRLTQPVAADADDPVVNNMLTAVAEADVSRTLDDVGDKLASYGLSAARGDDHADAQGGHACRALKVRQDDADRLRRVSAEGRRSQGLHRHHGASRAP